MPHEVLMAGSSCYFSPLCARSQRDKLVTRLGYGGRILKGGTKQMSEPHGTAIPYGPATRKANDEKFEYAYALRQRNKEVILKFPNGLVVSSDEEVRRKLGEILGQCGLAPVFASTVIERGMALAGNEVFIVLCDDCLSDGKYVDIGELAGQSDTKVLVVVVSRPGGG